MHFYSGFYPGSSYFFPAATLRLSPGEPQAAFEDKRRLESLGKRPRRSPERLSPERSVLLRPLKLSEMIHFTSVTGEIEAY